MINYFIYAKDVSGSTRGQPYFHENGMKTLEHFKTDVEKIKRELENVQGSPVESRIIYLNWGDQCTDVDESVVIRGYRNLEGQNQSTDPSTIINWLKKADEIGDENSKIRLLYIITDGMVPNYTAEQCFELNQNMYYERVVFHAFNRHENEIDLSVAASFFKNHCMVYCNNELHDCVDIASDFDYDKINIDNFDSEQNNLKSYIKLKFLKTSKQDARALAEIEKLKKLRARLFHELSSKPDEKRPTLNFETKDRNVFINEFKQNDWYKNLHSTMQDSKVDVEKAITTMINYVISERKSYSFDALKFHTQFAKPVEEEPIVDVNFTTEQEIEFPDIILDDEKGIPVIILTKFDLLEKLIFHGNYSENVKPASFSKFKSTMECPLFLVKDKDISESIGYFYTYNVYKQLLANGTRTEPRTRKPFNGGLVVIDTNQFDQYNDYILSATYFKSKKIKFNVGLFYYVLWKNCENKEWMDKNVVEEFKKYTMRRITETVCKIGLSCLPLDPQHNTSLLTALWYCVDLSSCIFKGDPQNFHYERLRMYYSVAQYMIEILRYFEYDLDMKCIEQRRELLSEVMTLKKIPTLREKVYYLLSKIFKTVDGFLVAEIEKPFNIHRLNYLKLNHKMMLPDVNDEEVRLNEFIHLLHFEDHGNSKIEICEKTLRPYFTIDSNESFYTKLLQNTKKVVINFDDKNKVKVSLEPIDSLQFDRLLSRFNLYIGCVKYSQKYPTLTEFIEYVSRKKKYMGDLVTIFPTTVYSDIKDAFDLYQEIVSKVTVEKFREIRNLYRSRIDRVKAEGRVTFNSDNEINEFISREELKVKLNKKT